MKARLSTYAGDCEGRRACASVGYEVAEQQVVDLHRPEHGPYGSPNREHVLPVARRVAGRQIGRVGDVRARPSHEAVAADGRTPSQEHLRARSVPDVQGMLVVALPESGADRAVLATDTILSTAGGMVETARVDALDERSVTTGAAVRSSLVHPRVTPTGAIRITQAKGTT
jgi:hypothetical protein